MNFIAEARSWYKMHSVWLAGAIAAFAVAWFFLEPIRRFVPLGGLIAGIVLLCVLLVIVRLVKQDDIVKLGTDVQMVGSQVVAGVRTEAVAAKTEFDKLTGRRTVVTGTSTSS